MGVLYEHWRPDLNECFYVGASWANPETRPYEMTDRNEDHIRIQEELAANNMAPEVKVIDCSGLLDEELDVLEALQITYWKELIGDRLVNRANGGRTGWGFAWSEEMCDQQSTRMVEFYKTSKGKFSRSKQAYALVEKYASEEGEAVKTKIRLGLKKFRETEEGKMVLSTVGEKISQTLKSFYASSEGETTKTNLSESCRKQKIEFYKTERGKQVAAEQGAQHSVKLKNFYKTAEGARLRNEKSRTMAVRSKGSGNPNATTKEDIAQKILDFAGGHKEAACIYGVSEAVAYNIKTRRSWRHLTPSNS